mgnify:CR=1 FL=1
MMTAAYITLGIIALILLRVFFYMKKFSLKNEEDSSYKNMNAEEFSEHLKQSFAVDENEKKRLKAEEKAEYAREISINMQKLLHSLRDKIHAEARCGNSKPFFLISEKWESARSCTTPRITLREAQSLESFKKLCEEAKNIDVAIALKIQDLTISKDFGPGYDVPGQAFAIAFDLKKSYGEKGVLND